MASVRMRRTVLPVTMTLKNYTKLRIIYKYDYSQYDNIIDIQPTGLFGGEKPKKPRKFLLFENHPT